MRRSAELLVEKAKVKVFRHQRRTCLTQDLHLCARRTFHWLCGGFLQSKSAKSTAQVSTGLIAAQTTCKDCDRMLLKIEDLARVGEK